jgi:uncharacterized membrane protein
MYPRLPAGLPLRFARGVPMMFQLKTPLVVMLPAIVQSALVAIFGALVLLLLWRARPEDLNPAAEGDAFRMRMAAEGTALLAAIWIAVQAVGAVRLVLLWQRWERGEGSLGELYTVTIVTGIVLSVIVGARTMKLVGREHRTPPHADPAVWRLRHLYFNPHDPALFVPTRTGVGWTLNFGRPLAIVLLAVTLTVGVGGPYLLARIVLRGLGN